MPSEMLTVAEAAQRLKMNPQTVRRWVRGGVLRAVKIGPKRYRVNPADVRECVFELMAVKAAESRARARRLIERGFRMMEDQGS
jgi:excisionase family DNA binding protein